MKKPAFKDALVDDLAEFSDAELQRELERREKSKRIPPTINPKPDIIHLRTCVEAQLKEEMEREYFDEDTYHFIYEKVMEMFYGKDFWEWHNKLPWR